jgi:rubrerythrin
VSDDAERAWLMEHEKSCDCPEAERVLGSYHPSNKRRFLAGFAARDAEIVGLKERGGTLVDKVGLWVCEECGHAVEEEPELEEDQDPCDVCEATRAAYNAFVDLLDLKIAAPAPGAKP